MPFKKCRRRFVIKIAFDIAHKSVALFLLLSALFSRFPSLKNVAVTILEGHQNVQKMVDKSNIVYRDVL